MTTLDVRPSLQGKTVFVTGGMSGMGRACVDSLSAHGCRVAFTYAEGHESAAAAAARVADAPAVRSCHALDLQSPASIERAFTAAVAHWGDIDILVHAAAVGSATVARYAADPGAQDSAMLAINADGALKICQLFVAHAGATITAMPRKLILFSSVGGGVSQFPGFRLSDGMSKAAVAFLTKQLAAEHVHTALDVFALCPGATDTPMFRASTLDGMTPAEQAVFAAQMPKGRLIQPSDIADIVVFLASAYSTPLHGAVIDASMGLGVRPGVITERGH